MGRRSPLRGVMGDVWLSGSLAGRDTRPCDCGGGHGSVEEDSSEGPGLSDEVRSREEKSTGVTSWGGGHKGSK